MIDAPRLWQREAGSRHGIQEGLGNPERRRAVETLRPQHDASSRTWANDERLVLSLGTGVDCGLACSTQKTSQIRANDAAASTPIVTMTGVEICNRSAIHGRAAIRTETVPGVQTAWRRFQQHGRDSGRKASITSIQAGQKMSTSLAAPAVGDWHHRRHDGSCGSCAVSAHAIGRWDVVRMGSASGGR